MATDPHKIDVRHNPVGRPTTLWQRAPFIASKDIEQAGVIYRAVNLINGRDYIGKTKLSLRQRVYQHVRKKSASRSMLHRAIKKYGPEVFRFSVLMGGLREPELSREEIRLIAALRPSYNITAGGEGCVRKHSEATKQKLREARARQPTPRGWKHTPEYRARMSAARRGIPTGRITNPLGMDILTAAITRGIPIKCLTTGKFYNSAQEAGREVGSHGASVLRVCRGQAPALRGRIYRYVSEMMT